MLVFCTMLNSFVRCRMTTGKIFAKKLCTNLFRLKLFKKKKICQKLLTAHVQSELFLKNQIDQKISFVFPQLSLKYILVLVSRVPICGQTLPRAAAAQSPCRLLHPSLSPPYCQYHGQKYCMPFNNRAICKALKKVQH